MKKSNQCSKSNSALLRFLLQRQKFCKTACIHNKQWPGKHMPNFATPHTHRINSQNKRHQNILVCKRSADLLLRNRFVHSVQGSPRSLSLKPQNPAIICKTGKGKQIKDENKRYRKTCQNGFFDEKVRHEAGSVSEIFKNSKISKKVSELVEVKIKQQNKKAQKLSVSKSNQFKLSAHRCSDNILQRFNKFRSKSFKQVTQTQYPTPSKSKLAQNMSEHKYVVDYATFGFIEKIKDNPQLWAKYVRKVD